MVITRQALAVGAALAAVALAGCTPPSSPSTSTVTSSASSSTSGSSSTVASPTARPTLGTPVPTATAGAWVLTVFGYGPLVLNQSGEAARAAGMVRWVQDQTCQGAWQFAADQQGKPIQGFAQVEGHQVGGKVVSFIIAGGSPRTIDGIGISSTEADVGKAFPGAGKVDAALTTLFVARQEGARLVVEVAKQDQRVVLVRVERDQGPVTSLYATEAPC